ncbi:MAG: phosphatidate cytidylyltransferase [Terrimicrobiaceae bacterium]|nr:phosphatidate cytidylyltransferase [Terrimicrobiaceae bacterium]
MNAFAHPATVGICIFLAALLAVTPVIFEILQRCGRLTPALRKELNARYFSWLVLVPLMVAPILLGRLWTVAALGLLSLFAYREFARATGFFRHRALSATVVLGIALMIFAMADHWYGFFVALPSLVVSALVIVAIAGDEPKGYLQRVALAVFAFALFGVCLGHVGYLANDGNFRPILLLILLCVEINDVFAFCCGKLFGRRKLAPHTSPGKTWGGALGALVLTTALFAAIGSSVFAGTVLAAPVHLLSMGVLLSFTGQLGDLVISSVKRDLGIKDMAATIPGHGGLLDRFDSLLFVGPALFHYIGYFVGVGLDQPARVFF